MAFMEKMSVIITATVLFRAINKRQFICVSLSGVGREGQRLFKLFLGYSREKQQGLKQG